MSTDETQPGPIEVVVGPEQAGKRLDVFLAEQFPLYSRTHLRKAIASEDVSIEGFHPRSAFKLKVGQKVLIRIPERPAVGAKPEELPLEILFEDEAIIVVNKRPAMVVNPAKGNWSGTLASALAFHFEQLSTIGGPTRPGIVHRLDRETSGVIIVAKTDRAHLSLNHQFETRIPEKEYFAITINVPNHDRDAIEAPIGIHPYQREKMAVRVGHESSRESRSFYEVAERFAGFAAVRVWPKTGRTHQIRVHLAHIGCPVLCDKQYGGRARITLGEIRHRREDEEIALQRTALHARRLKLLHPLTSEPVEFEAPIPADIESVLLELRQYRSLSGAAASKV